MRLAYPVVLASASPRRCELLRSLIPEFEVIAAEVDEAPLPQEPPEETAVRLARDKALSIYDSRPSSLVIAGDTVVAVAVDKALTQLGKPAHAAEATDMLKALSGRSHVVTTGLCLRWPKGMRILAETTTVQFRELSDAEIAAYVATGEPNDKAGAYAIQGGARDFVIRVEGSLTNVVGLPMERLEECLRSL